MRDLAHLIGHQARVVLRTPRAVFGGVLLPVVLLALRTGDPHANRVVGGLCVLGVLSTAYMTHTSALVAARQYGVLKRWRMTPLPPAAYLGSRVAATVALAAASGAVTIVAGVLFAGVRIEGVAAVGLMAVLVVGAMAWASIGTALSAFIPSAEAAWPILAVTYLPVLALSGSFGALSVPGWLATVVDYVPAAPLIDAATRALSGATPLTAHDLLVPAVWAVAGIFVAQRSFRWERA
jgi:ABC-2 type transport system permease protein